EMWDVAWGGEEVGGRVTRLAQPVAVDRQTRDALVAQRCHKAGREPVGHAEAGDADARTVHNVVNRSSRRGNHLVHRGTVPNPPLTDLLTISHLAGGNTKGRVGGNRRT